MKSLRFILFSFAIMIGNCASGQLWTQYADSARFFQEKSNYDSAIIYFKKSVDFLKVDSAGTATLAQFQFSIGLLYAEKGEYREAADFVQEARAARLVALGSQHPDYAKCCNILGSIYIEMGEYKNAELMFYEARAVYERIYGKINKSYAAVCNNLGMLFRIQGLFSRAEPFYHEAKGIFEGLNGRESQAYANCCNSLGLLYLDKEEFEQSELFFLECKTIREKLLGKKHLYCGDIYNNLALLYQKLGQFQKAENLFTEARLIYLEKLGNQHADYALSCNNLADVLSDLKEYSKAEALYLEAKGIRETALGRKHPEYAKSCNNLGGLYFKWGQPQKAMALFQEAKEIRELNFGKDNIEYAESCNNLGTLYTVLARYPEAEKLYLEAMETRKRILGKVSSVYIESCSNLGSFYRGIKKPETANYYFRELFSAQRELMRKVFLFTSESEQQAFIRITRDNADRIFSFYSTPGFEMEHGLDYDMSVAMRTPSLISLHKMKQDVNTNNDTLLHNKYEVWISLREQLAYWMTKPVKERAGKDSLLEERSVMLEKELARLSSAFSQRQPSQVSWKELKQFLHPGEAAIEFAAFRYFDSDRLSDSVFYIAMVLRKDKPAPLFIKLFEQRQLDDLLATGYTSAGEHQINQIYSGFKTTGKAYSLYDLVWKPLEVALNGIGIAYYAPAGSLHKISFAGIATGKNEFLSDKVRLVQLNTTAAISGKLDYSLMDAPKINVFGGVQYDADSASLANAASKKYQNDIVSRSLPGDLSRDGIPGFRYLQGTEKEALAIQFIGQAKKTSVKTYLGLEATEEAFKSLSGKHSPIVLHIATHGFFFPDPRSIKKDKGVGGSSVFRQSDNPLIRSGLALAGANNAWKGKPVKGVEDGILTSYEVSNMYLPNTKLAVLSACETGLGDIQGSEGVYGLQRAFKMAGVENLVMSLWKVPDAETAEFMQEFYKNLFNRQTINDAFSSAQKIMKNKYRKEPYKWAAWVLIR